MALLSFITGKTPRRTKLRSDVGVDLLVIDVTKVITPQFDSDVTENPVEDDTAISDNIRPKPVTIQIEGEASESPLNLEASLAGLITSAAGALGGALAGAASSGLGSALGSVAGGLGASLLLSSDDKAAKARDVLTSIWEERRMFDIAAPSIRSEYTKNLVMQSLSFPRTATTGGKVAFSMTLKQIRIVETQTVKVSRLATSVKHTGGKKDKTGKRGANTASEGKGKSILSALTGAGL